MFSSALKDDGKFKEPPLGTGREILEIRSTKVHVNFIQILSVCWDHFESALHKGCLIAVAPLEQTQNTNEMVSFLRLLRAMVIRRRH